MPKGQATFVFLLVPKRGKAVCLKLAPYEGGLSACLTESGPWGNNTRGGGGRYVNFGENDRYQKPPLQLPDIHIDFLRPSFGWFTWDDLRAGRSRQSSLSSPLHQANVPVTPPVPPTVALAPRDMLFFSTTSGISFHRCYHTDIINDI